MFGKSIGLVSDLELEWNNLLHVADGLAIENLIHLSCMINPT